MEGTFRDFSQSARRRIGMLATVSVLATASTAMVGLQSSRTVQSLRMQGQAIRRASETHRGLVHRLAQSARQSVDESRGVRVGSQNDLRASLLDWQAGHRDHVRRLQSASIEASKEAKGALEAAEKPAAELAWAVTRLLSTTDPSDQSVAAVQTTSDRLLAVLAEVDHQLGDSIEERVEGAAATSQNAFLLTIALLGAQSAFVLRPVLRGLGVLIEDAQGARSALSTHAADLEKKQRDLISEGIRRESADEALKNACRDTQSVSEQHRVAARRFQDLFKNVPVPCYTFNIQGRIFEWNDAAARLWARSPWEMFQRSSFSELFPDEEGRFLRILVERVFDGKPLNGLEVRHLRGDGSIGRGVLSVIPLYNAGSKVSGALASLVELEPPRTRDDVAPKQGISQNSSKQ